VAGVVGLAEALALAQDERELTGPRLRALASKVLSELPQKVPGCRITGHPSSRLPGHASFVFEGIEIASVLLGLDRHDIWASSGSACTSASSEPSHVLVAMGVPRAWLFGALRLTFGRDSLQSSTEVGTLLEVVSSLVVGARPTVMAAV
jgi:cysteine desulfurase